MYIFLGYPDSQQTNFPGPQMLNDPMASMAMQYGTSLAGQGKELLNKNVSIQCIDFKVVLQCRPFKCVMSEYKFVSIFVIKNSKSI